MQARAGVAALQRVLLEPETAYTYLHYYLLLTSPPTRAPCDPSEVTTCVPSDAYVLGVTRLPSGACSASTSLIFRGSDQIAKLAAHAWQG